MTPADVERLIAKQGRTMMLRRLASGDVVIKAVMRSFTPREIAGDIAQGDREVKLSNKEIRAMNWPGPPAPGDQVLVDGLTLTVENVDSGFLGEDVAIHTLTVRG